MGMDREALSRKNHRIAASALLYEIEGRNGRAEETAVMVVLEDVLVFRWWWLFFSSGSIFWLWILPPSDMGFVSTMVKLI